MTENKPIGVKLIAAYFFAKSTALVCAAVIGSIYPALQHGANEFVCRFYPELQQFDAIPLGVKLTPALALFGLVEGFGMWLLQRWARTLILLNLIYNLSAGAIAAALLWHIDRKMLLSITSVPYWIVGVGLSVLVLGYLLDPDTKQAFGVPADQSW